MSEAEIRAEVEGASEYVPGDDLVAAKRQRLLIGSDVEMAERVARDLRKEFGEIIFDDGCFWHYTGSAWDEINETTKRRAVHLYDGATFETPAHEISNVKLGKGRVDSVLHEMRAILARPGFFGQAPAGINCASGFIAFGADGQPRIFPHRTCNPLGLRLPF